MDLYTQANQPVFPRAETESEFGSLMGHANHLKSKRKCLAWKAVCYAMHYIWMWGVYKLAWPKENIKGRDSLMRKMHYLTPGLTELAFSAARVLRLDLCMFLGKWREIAFNGVGDWEPEHQDEANLSSIFQHAPENVFLMMLRWVERKASSGS